MVVQGRPGSSRVVSDESAILELIGGVLARAQLRPAEAPWCCWPGSRPRHVPETRARKLGHAYLDLDIGHRETAPLALDRVEGRRRTGTGEPAGLPIPFFRKPRAPETIESTLADPMDDRPGRAISG